MKKLVLPAMALAALALGTLAQVGDAEARRGYRGGGGFAYRGVAVRGPRGGVAYRGAAVGRGYRGGHYGYRRGYGVPLAVGAIGAAATKIKRRSVKTKRSRTTLNATSTGSSGRRMPSSSS